MGSSAPVKTKKHLAANKDAPALRAFCARHNVTWAEIARLLGCSRSYVCDVAQADRRQKSVSPRKWDEIWSTVFRILRDRELSYGR